MWTKRKVNYILFLIFILLAFVQVFRSFSLLWLIYIIVAFTFFYENHNLHTPRILLWLLLISLFIYACIDFLHFMGWIQIEIVNELFKDLVYGKSFFEVTGEFPGILIAAIALLYHFKK